MTTDIPDITLDHQTFHAAIADVRRATAQLRDERDRLARQVDDLLDQGWRGTAASAYAEGWADWKLAAEAVLRGLGTMGDLLEAAHCDLLRTDLAAEASLDRVSARIVARLG
jgi:WXG100 family type VII secretion target